MVRGENAATASGGKVSVMSPGRSGQGGFTLAECLVALTLVGFTLVAATVAVSSQARAAERLRVRQELLQAAETTLEGIRGGAVPLVSTSSPEPLAPETGARFGGRSAVEVEPLAPAGLYEVRVRSWARSGGETMQLVVTTMVWRP
jgi:prepilin-type N-terminal cleavage/methylation domain-containing protein